MTEIELSQPGPDVLPLIAGRRSPAVFDPEYVLSDGELATLFDAARWAPSAGNSQPYRYIVGRRGDATFAAIEQTLTRGNRSWAPAASALVISLCQTKTLPGAKKDFIFAHTAEHDLGQATAYLTIQAHAMGLGVHQFIGFDVDALAQALDVAPQWRVMAGLAIGRAWPESERQDDSPAVRALAKQVAEYNLENNAGREARPRTRRPVSQVWSLGKDSSRP